MRFVDLFRTVPSAVCRNMSRTVVLTALFSLGAACTTSDEPIAAPAEFELTFEETFDGAEGDLPDLSNWTFDLGTGPNGDGWGNQEQQFYTGRPDNISLDGEGHLRITAREESFGGRSYTSSRIRTQDRFEQRYGRFEARIRLPAGQGIWPAFWMLGNDFPDEDSTPEEIQRGQWPRCGEIDIMEFRGQETQVVAGTVHGPGYSGGNSVGDSFRTDGPGFDEEFHVFAVEWDPGRITWFVDGERYHTVTSSQINSLPQLPGEPPAEWVFDHPFFMILNVAVGGTYVGPPDASTVFPATMLIDYVRVYRRTSDGQ